MGRGSSQASGAATAGQNFANQSGANAQGLYSTLAPELLSESAHPAGFAPSDLAAMNTAEQQSTGGSQAAAVGQGSLMAGRTRNAGTADAAIGQGVRGAGESLAKGALSTQMANARMRETQHQEGIHGLESLTGLETGSVAPALNSVAGNVNANTNAENASWDWAKYILDPAMQAAGQSKYV